MRSTYRRSLRIVALIVTMSVALQLVTTTRAALLDAGMTDAVLMQFTLLALIVSVGLAVEIYAQRFNLAFSTFWAWSLVFLVLAPAQQLAQGTYPWGWPANQATYVQTINLLQLTFALTLLGQLATKWRHRQQLEVPGSPAREFGYAPGLKRLLMVYAGFVVSANVAFAAAMGPALFQERAAFRVRLLEIASLPFGGTLYFLVTAGSIVIAPALLVARKRGIPVPYFLVILCVASALYVTNPLAGSRFLTGSLWVGIAAALLMGKTLERLLPLSAILLMVLVFPTLDTLRGDGTGSARVQVSSQAESLTDYDFDAFEMLVREQSLTDVPFDDRIVLGVAPVLRWVPILSRPFIGDAGGAYVAERTGMDFTNVSLPVWAEIDLLFGGIGVLILGATIGVALERLRPISLDMQAVASQCILPSIAALMFILLRGSIYEVLSYLLLALLVAGTISRLERRIESERSIGGVLPSTVPQYP